MALGPGKYDDEAMRILLQENAVGVALIVIGGKPGAGGTAMKLSVPAGPDAHDDAIKVMNMMAGLMRSIADEIEQDAVNPDLKLERGH
jgi:hypothetical protein